MVLYPAQHLQLRMSLSGGYRGRATSGFAKREEGVNAGAKMCRRVNEGTVASARSSTYHPASNRAAESTCENPRRE